MSQAIAWNARRIRNAIGPEEIARPARGGGESGRVAWSGGPRFAVPGRWPRRPLVASARLADGPDEPLLQRRPANAPGCRRPQPLPDDPLGQDLADLGPARRPEPRTGRRPPSSAIKHRDPADARRHLQRLSDRPADGPRTSRTIEPLGPGSGRGRSSTATRPRTIMMTRPQTASTSDMMCVESRMVCRSPSSRIKARTSRICIGSRPAGRLVEDQGCRGRAGGLRPARPAGGIPSRDGRGPVFPRRRAGIVSSTLSIATRRRPIRGTSLSLAR